MIDVGDKKLNARLAVIVPTIYHYTCASTLPVFFCPNADLYCTNSKCLNDPTELYLGAITFIEYLYGKGDIDLKHARMLKSCIENMIRNDNFVVWIMSLSELGDDLALWRGYAADKDGGYAIGFNTQRLVKVLELLTGQKKIARANHVPVLTRCWYLNEKDKSDIETLYEVLLPIFKEELVQFNASTLPATTSLLRNLIPVLLLSSMHIKHNAFEQEKEARIIITVPGEDYSKVKILGGKPRMPLGVPSLECPLHELIDEIYISPHGNYDKLRTQVEWLKKSTGADFKIKKSSIPYDTSR